MSMYLQMDGVGDKLTLPVLFETRAVLTLLVENHNTVLKRVHSGSGNRNFFIAANGKITFENISSFKVDGVTIAETNTVDFPFNQKVTVELEYAVNSWQSVIFARHNSNANYVKGYIFDIKYYNSEGSLVAHYDMTTGTVDDQSGNNKHATLTGGTWAELKNHLQMDGVDDRIQIPAMNMTAIEMDLVSESTQTSGQQRYWSLPFGTSYLMRVNGVDEWHTTVSDVTVDGVQVAANKTAFIPLFKRIKVRSNLSSMVNQTIHVFNNNGNIAFAKGQLYDIKIYNGTTLMAHYDITSGTVEDQSGNGRHATLTGGTWIEIEEPGGGTEPEPDLDPVNHTLSLADAVASNDVLYKRLFIGVADVIATTETSNEGAHKTITDAIEATDNTSREMRKSLNVADAISMSDTASSAPIYVQNQDADLTDSIAMIDTISKRLFLDVTDAIATADTSSKSLSAYVSVSDTILTEEGSSERTDKYVSDSLSAADSEITFMQGKAINLNDSLTMADVITKQLRSNVTDSVTMNDEEDETILKTLLDNIALSDSLLTQGGREILLVDSINVTDSISASKRLSRLLVETVNMSEGFAKESEQSLRLYDVLVLEDVMRKEIGGEEYIILETVNMRNIVVDVRKKTSTTIEFLQNDTSIINFILTENGVASSLELVDRIVVNYERPDGKVISSVLEADLNHVTYELGEEEMAISGKGKIVLQFYSGTKRLSTFPLNVLVHKSIEPNFE